MNSDQLRQGFLDFFKNKGHKIVSSSSLLPADPSVLFTTAGMQQFKSYFLGEKSPFGNKVASCQKCFRTSDIELVGDDTHLTFLEMLGNFSFGAYYKEVAIKLVYEFLFKKLKLSLKDAVFTVFGGDGEVPADEESVLIWKKLGIPEEKIKKYSRKDNFWGPTGKEGPCGPTTEIHVGGVELWNLVFNEYYQDENKRLTLLKQKGVDTGMGLERLAMVVQGKSNVFETDLFQPFFTKMEKPQRIISDHIRGAVFLAAEGIFSSNVERGYILRRILRRAIRYRKLLDLPQNFLILLAQKVIEIYKDIYPEVKSKESDILTIIQGEEEKFEKTLHLGLKQFEKIAAKGDMSGQEAFHLFDTYGFPPEMTQELAREKGIKVDKEGFEAAFKKHQEISRAGLDKKFKSGLADDSEKTIKYHTATHLLLAAMREILGSETYQKGSNITVERLRFDFNYPQKLSEDQMRKIEDLVNQKINEDIAVEMLEMPKDEAIKIAKISFDSTKYGEIVKVYKIDNFSIELCAGPHVQKTGELGHLKIVKEESSGAGIRRIRAILDLGGLDKLGDI